MMEPGAAFSDRVSSFRLQGGARLAVLSNPHAPTVTVAGTLLAGPAWAKNGRFAVPGMVAAMLDRGTIDHSRIELARELEDHGLQLVVRASASSPHHCFLFSPGPGRGAAATGEAADRGFAAAQFSGWGAR